MYTLSVSSLNEQIKTVLESSFNQVFVEGELSRITFHNSGHIYFSLKDSNSTISAVMFRGNANKLKFRLEEGMKVLINAALTLYKPRGSYQLNCFSIEPSGQGALALAFEQLKEKLLNQGYFAPEIKKELPQFPKKIALITSATGAALQDMLRVAEKRFRAVSFAVYDVLVQGESAATQIANAVSVADTKEYDILVVSRGGGSIEDLWAFNEEVVADAIFQAKTPLISAVGHEIDWLMSDFVADVRAATPSAAMEICLPDTNELYQTLDSLQTQYSQSMNQIFNTKNQELLHLKNLFSQHSVEKKLELKKEEIKQLQVRFLSMIEFKMQNFTKELSHMQTLLETNHPKHKSKKGFAQLSKDAKVIALDALAIGDVFQAQSDTLSVEAKVIQIRQNKEMTR